MSGNEIVVSDGVTWPGRSHWWNASKTASAWLASKYISPAWTWSISSSSNSSAVMTSPTFSVLRTRSLAKPNSLASTL